MNDTQLRTAYSVYGITLVIEGDPADGIAYFRPRGRKTWDKVTITDVTDEGFTASVEGHDVPAPARYIEGGLSWDGWHYKRQPEPFTDEIFLSKPSDAPRSTRYFMLNMDTGDALCVRASNDRGKPGYKIYLGPADTNGNTLPHFRHSGISFNREDGAAFIQTPFGSIDTADSKWINLGADYYDYHETDTEVTYTRKV